MSRVEIEFRPLDSWPAAERRSPLQQSSQFRAGWAETKALLLDEADKLGAAKVLLQVDVDESQILVSRAGLKSHARPATPRVAVTLDTDRGPLTFRCHMIDSSPGWAMTAWQMNVRAIALGLKALRAVDRYGITETGEQYSGFGALPAATGIDSKARAKEVLFGAAGEPSPSSLTTEQVYRRALRRSHPDVETGSREAFDKVQAAARLLGVAS